MVDNYIFVPSRALIKRGFTFKHVNYQKIGDSVATYNAVEMSLAFNGPTLATISPMAVLGFLVPRPEQQSWSQSLDWIDKDTFSMDEPFHGHELRDRQNVSRMFHLGSHKSKESIPVIPLKLDQSFQPVIVSIKVRYNDSGQTLMTDCYVIDAMTGKAPEFIKNIPELTDKERSDWLIKKLVDHLKELSKVVLIGYKICEILTILAESADGFSRKPGAVHRSLHEHLRKSVLGVCDVEWLAQPLSKDPYLDLGLHELARLVDCVDGKAPLAQNCESITKSISNIINRVQAKSGTGLLQLVFEATIDLSTFDPRRMKGCKPVFEKVANNSSAQSMTIPKTEDMVVVFVHCRFLKHREECVLRDLLLYR